jgi:hypothetical protein
MMNWLRPLTLWSLLMTPSIAHAEIRLLCSFGGKALTLITVNEQTKKAESLVHNSPSP